MLKESSLAPHHWQEWCDSAVAPDIIAANVESLSGHHALEAILYAFFEHHCSPYVTIPIRQQLDRYATLEAGGWFVSGLDPLNYWQRMEWGRFKPDTPRIAHKNGNLKPIKYESPLKTRTRATFLEIPNQPNFWQTTLNTNSCIYLTEGEKKAGCLLSLGYPAIALPGIWNGCPKDDLGIPRLIPELEVFATPGRLIVIVFDEDDNSQSRQAVDGARYRLASLLQQRGCPIQTVTWNRALGKGIDDVAAHHEADCIHTILSNLIPITPPSQPGEPDRDLYDRVTTAQAEQDRLDQIQFEIEFIERLKYWLRPRRSKQGFTSPSIPLLQFPTHEYYPGARLQVWQDAIAQGYRYILDTSCPGAGKSFDAGRVLPEIFGANQVIYASDQHRNPTVKTLESENGWIDLEARHGGLVYEATPIGSTRLKRVSAGQVPNIPANCSRHQILSTLRSKHIDGADTAALICSTCPLREPCTHSEGSGYGFLHQRRSALSCHKLRSHLDSLPDPLDYDLSETILLVDEPGQNFGVKRDLTITLQDPEQTIVKLVNDPLLFEALHPLFAALLPLLNGSIKVGRFGIAHSELIQQLPLPGVNVAVLRQVLQPDLSFLNPTAEQGVDLADLPRALRKQFADRDPVLAEKAHQRVVKQWLPDLIEILAGQRPGASMRIGSGGLVLSQLDRRHRSAVQATKTTIFLDGTLSPQDLALKLGCRVEEIFVCCQVVPQSQHLTLIQVTDLGRLGMQRGADQQRRAQAIVTHYRQQDSTTKVIDFKKFVIAGSGAWWRDSRGVNDFEQITRLILTGTPCRNLADLQAEYAILVGDYPNLEDEGFRAYVDRSIAAEFDQAIGRLRAHRRLNTPLEVILLSNFEVTLPVQRVKASDLTLEAATKRERFMLAVQGAIQQLRSAGAKVMQTAIAALAGYSQQYVSKQRELLQRLLRVSNSNSSNPMDPPDEITVAVSSVVNEVVNGITELEIVCETVDEVFWGWLEPCQWAEVWQQIRAISQVRILEVLIFSLSPTQLQDLSADGC
jgi:hypothetical protein